MQVLNWLNVFSLYLSANYFRYITTILSIFKKFELKFRLHINTKLNLLQNLHSLPFKHQLRYEISFKTNTPHQCFGYFAKVNVLLLKTV